MYQRDERGACVHPICGVLDQKQITLHSLHLTLWRLILACPLYNVEITFWFHVSGTVPVPRILRLRIPLCKYPLFTFVWLYQIVEFIRSVIISFMFYVRIYQLASFSYKLLLFKEKLSFILVFTQIWMFLSLFLFIFLSRFLQIMLSFSKTATKEC